jgi:replicative DNA helicase
MHEARFITASDALADWRDHLLSGTPPVLYPVGTGDLARVEVGPGVVTLLGGAPGAGKTALAMQWCLDALRITPSLHCVVCNVETAPFVLLDRQLARLSGIDLTVIRHRRLGAEHARRVEEALATLEALADRLAFVRPPFDLGNVAAAADAFEAGLLVLDYIQRIAPPGQHGDRRGAVDATMSYLRQFADAGVAVVVLAAVSRGKDKHGRSSYGEGLNLASFRESSELEFGADDAFLLVPDGEDAELVTLRHLKSRHGEPRDITLRFHRRLQRFAPAARPGDKGDPGKLQAALAALWERTAPARDDQAGEEGG